MRPELRSAWERALGRAEAWQPDEDPEPVLEALALLLVVDLTGDLGAVAEADRALLRDRGRRALLSGPPAPDEDWQLARSLARAGFDRLEGRPARPPADPLCPPDGSLLGMLRGEPDGLSAGQRAAHVAGCEACRRSLRVLDLAQGGGAQSELAVAAAAAAPMRAPTEGRPLAELEDPEAEAVLFEEGGERRLAVYATAAAPVRLEAEGVTTEQMLSGYWLGRVPAGRDRIRARLHVGSQTVDWEIDLTAG